MGLEAEPRQTRSTPSRLLGRGCLAVIVALMTLSLHVNPPLAQPPQPVEAASTSPFWLDPPPTPHASLIRRQSQRVVRSHEPVAAKAARVARQSPLTTAFTSTVVPLTPTQSLLPMQLNHPEVLVNHKVVSQQPAVASVPKKLSAAPRLAGSPAAEEPSQVDQEFSRTFSGPENTPASSNPVQDLPHGPVDSAGSLSSATALQTQRSTDNSGDNSVLAAPIRMGDVAVKAEALVQHSEATSPVSLGARYDAVKVRTSITVPTFHHPLRLSVGGGYEHLVQPNEGRAGTVLDTPPGAGTDEGSAETGTSSTPALNSASRLDLQRTGYVATASLPVSTHLDLGVGYSQHQVRGGAGLTQGTPIEEHQELYTGSVTYAPGDGRSSLSIVGRASRAIDTLAPVDATVKRGDILFSVKF